MPTFSQSLLEHFISALRITKNNIFVVQFKLASPIFSTRFAHTFHFSDLSFENWTRATIYKYIETQTSNYILKSSPSFWSPISLAAIRCFETADGPRPTRLTYLCTPPTPSVYDGLLSISVDCHYSGMSCLVPEDIWQ